jgi:7,8-dihydropterin-6-yl-methyl-4-(beta-D-ribofuranosyl)aminobenzene 5'-phosphate synthase
MKKSLVGGIALLGLIAYLKMGPSNQEKPLENQPQIMPKPDLTKTKVTLITVYDNYQHDSSLQTGWGFACLVRLEPNNQESQTILFDTGADSQTLLANMEKLNIDPGEIDAIFLSHIHNDHVGGLFGLLEKNSDLKVYLPISFPKEFKDRTRSYGAEVVEVSGPAEILSNVYSTGELANLIKEQSLIVRTEKGLILLTGCAHPGVVKIIKQAKEMLNEDVYLVMGGFHLSGASDTELREIIKEFKGFGVRKAAPCHCSGKRCRELFEQAYQENFIKNGVGKLIKI